MKRHRTIFTALLALLCFLPAAGDEPKPHALLTGTVFTEDGLALPDIPVSIKRATDHKVRWRARSDARGEFALRLPPGPVTYEIATDSKRHQNQSKTVEFKGEEHLNVIFRLSVKTRQEEK